LFRPPAQANPGVVLTATDTIIGNLVAAPADDVATHTAKTDRQARFVTHGFAVDFATALVSLRA